NPARRRRRASAARPRARCSARAPGSARRTPCSPTPPSPTASTSTTRARTPSSTRAASRSPRRSPPPRPRAPGGARPSRAAPPPPGRAGAGGRGPLPASIAAVEVMCRVGLAVPGAFHARHFHPTAITGSFAAAAAAARIRKPSEDQLPQAFGICGSQAAGIIEYLVDGTWTKRLHPGWNGHAGVIATVLAETGFTGPESVLEGGHGLYAAFAGGHDAGRLEGLLATLGRRWEVAEVTFKPYPCGWI